MENSPNKRALFLEAPSRQGGHSERGYEISEALGVPFPLSMGPLFAAAQKEGFDPAELWPWLVEQQPGWFPKSAISLATGGE